MKEIIQKQTGIGRFSFSHFVIMLGELQNMMLLLESDKVNISRDVVQQKRSLMKNR